MTGRELAAFVNATGSYRPDPRSSMTVNVIIVDARNRFGSVDVLIEPISGDGTQWISLDRFRPDADA